MEVNDIILDVRGKPSISKKQKSGKIAFVLLLVHSHQRGLGDVYFILQVIVHGYRWPRLAQLSSLGALRGGHLYSFSLFLNIIALPLVFFFILLQAHLVFTQAFPLRNPHCFYGRAILRNQDLGSRQGASTCISCVADTLGGVCVQLTHRCTHTCVYFCICLC